MPDDKKLTDDEKRIIYELTDKLIATSDEKKTVRAELFNRLSTLVEGVKLGLSSKTPTTV